MRHEKEVTAEHLRERARREGWDAESLKRWLRWLAYWQRNKHHPEFFGMNVGPRVAQLT